VNVKEIKERTKGYDEFYLIHAIGIEPVEFEYLIQQAEKAEHYEKMRGYYK
jgi:hypothetical protein